MKKRRWNSWNNSTSHKTCWDCLSNQLPSFNPWKALSICSLHAINHIYSTLLTRNNYNLSTFKILIQKSGGNIQAQEMDISAGFSEINSLFSEETDIVCRLMMHTNWIFHFLLTILKIYELIFQIFFSFYSCSYASVAYFQPCILVLPPIQNENGRPFWWFNIKDEKVKIFCFYTFFLCPI